MEILKAEHLTFFYPASASSAVSEIPAVNDVSFTLERGQFVTVCGATGSGKSTLLRLLKRELTPLGKLTGSITLEGTTISALSARDAACAVGFVQQRPEQQLVTDRVWHELAFGPENLGWPTDVIRRRVAETAAFFGMEDWFEKDTDSLSGGQKQLLNLASVLVMQPRLLLLDEPTSQLDPIAASSFLETLKKLCRELSLTILLVEHRLEEALVQSDRLLVMENGALLDDGTPAAVVSRLNRHPALMEGMPAPARLFAGFTGIAPCPLAVREGRIMLEKTFRNEVRSCPVSPAKPSGIPALEMRDVFFRYERNAPDVLHGLTCTVYTGEAFCILGGNGSGKSTALGTAAGLNKPTAGHVRVFGKALRDYPSGSLYQHCLTLLPQDVQTTFLRSTVAEELQDAKITPQELPYDLTPLLQSHPYDLSGGEQQMVALAKALGAQPKLLLLDEPTKGLDAHARNRLIALLRQFVADGMTVVAVTHDVEFASLFADRCALFFRGEIVSSDIPRVFFAENNFYTTAANRMTRGFYDQVVTVEEARALCLQNGRKDGLPCV